MARRKLGRLDLNAIERLRLGWRLLRDPRVPVAPKLLVPLAALYIVSPIDVVPEILIPILGLVDDVGVIGAALAVISMLTRWAPPAVVAEHAATLGMIDLPDGAPSAGPGRPASAKGQPVEAEYWVDDWR